MISFIHNLKFFHKIMLIVLNVIVFMVVLVVIMNFGIINQREIIGTLVDTRFNIYAQISALSENIHTLDTEFKELLAASQNGIDPERGNAFSKKVKELLEPCSQEIETILAFKDIAQEERSNFSAVHDELKKYKQALVSVSTIGQLGGMNVVMATNDFVIQSSFKMKNIMSLIRQYETEKINDAKRTTINSLNKQNITFLIICILCIVLTIIMSYSISRTIVKPIENIVAYSKLIANGDFSRSCDISSKDEIGNLAHYFNALVKSIKESINNIKGVQGRNIDLKNDVIANTSETFAATTEINSNLASSTRMLKSLDQSVELSVTAAEDIVLITKEFRHQIEMQSATVTESSASIAQIVKSITNIAMQSSERTNKSKELIVITEQGKNKMSKTNDLIKEMNDVTGDMLNAIDFIEEVSSSTNILAMNAAIQAAHAGEAGKVFSVVADEIRMLAESSSSNSKIISTSLKKNVDTIKTLLDVSSETFDYFQTIGREVNQVVSTLEEISNAVQTSADAGKEITLAIKNLQEITGQVQSNSTHIEDKIEKIKEVIGKVNNVTSEVVNAITEIDEGAKQINTAMSTLTNNAISLEKGIIETSDAVDKFKT